MNNSIILEVVSITLLVMLLITGATLVLYMRQNKRIKKRMIVFETRLNFEKELRVVETEVTESMMAQFAHELRDNVGQLLTALHLQVENQKIDHPQLIASFTPTQSYIAEIHQQLRMMSRTLNNDYIGHVGLFAAINIEIERINSLKQLKILQNAIVGQTNLDKSQELMVFRIFQEILLNALRHAKARYLFVEIRATNSDFVLQVNDDGIGFNKTYVLNSKEFSGLRNIMKRAELAGLNFQLEASPGKGSLFIIKKRSNLEAVS